MSLFSMNEETRVKSRSLIARGSPLLLLSLMKMKGEMGDENGNGGKKFDDDDDLRDPKLCITLPPWPILLKSSYSQTYLTFQSFSSEIYLDVEI